MYTLRPFNFQADVHYLELVQARHKISFSSKIHSDVVQHLLCFYPGNLKKNLVDANKGTTLPGRCHSFNIRSRREIFIYTLPTGRSALILIRVLLC